MAAVAAHDLKSPIATISGFVEVIQEDLSKGNTIDASKHLIFIKNASARMIELVDHLLNYAKLASSKPKFEKVDLNNVVQSAIENLGAVTTETKARITTGELPTVKGEPLLLIQLFQNLIGNALKFSKGQPSVNIKVASANESEWEFCVEDQGVGFDPKFSKQIFELYKQLGGANDSKGAGIGLATCQKVVELHHGEIWAESQVGKGSRFVFTLPK